MPKAGDRVKITADKVFEGVLLPRPSVLDQDIVVLKLDSGYNIGIAKKKIKKTERVKEHKKKARKTHPIRTNPKLPSVSVISTGGTISSSIDYVTGGVAADFTAKDFVAMCPELSDIANLKAKKLMNVMSEDMCPEDWVKIAKSVVEELKSADGVVVTMGTDTLHVTAAALSFLIDDLSKPVIVTGAQRSIDRGSSDAFMNLVCSVSAAATWDAAEVATCLHGTMNDDFCLLVRAGKVRKMHTSRRDAFRPINDLPLARVFPDGCIECVQSCSPRSDAKPKVVKLNENVGFVYVHPNIDPKVVDSLAKSVEGLVVAATALGHVPTNVNSLVPVLMKHAKRMPIVICSQTLYGHVHPYVYTNLRRLSLETGCVFVEDTIPDAALPKLMVVLAKAGSVDEAKELMRQNMHGELGVRERAGCFLR